MTAERIKFNEPHYKTLVRNFLVALALAIIFLFYQLVRSKGGPFMFKGFAHNLLTFFWFTYGGHWVDLFVVNWLRFKLPSSRTAEIIITLLTWYAGGCFIFFAASCTNELLFGHAYTLNWYYAGFILIAVELLARASLRWSKRKPN